MSVDKAALLKPRLPEAEVEVPGVGTVRVRGLSRAEALELRHVDRSVPGAFERKMVALAMVDPELTEDEVGEWQRNSGPYELEPVTAKVNDLSALSKEAAKEAYKEFESDPDGEFRVLPGGEVRDDGGSPPG